MENLITKINEFVEEQIKDVQKYGHTQFSTAYGYQWDKDIYAYRKVIAKKLTEKGYNVRVEHRHEVYDYCITMKDIPNEPEKKLTTCIIGLCAEEENAKETAYLMRDATYKSWDELNKFINDHFVNNFTDAHVMKLDIDTFISALNNDDIYTYNWFFTKVFVYE